MSKQGSTFEPEDGSLKKPNKKSKKPFTIEYRVIKRFRHVHPSWKMWSKWHKYSSYKNRGEALKALKKNQGEYGMYEFRKGE